MVDTFPTVDTVGYTISSFLTHGWHLSHDWHRGL